MKHQPRPQEIEQKLIARLREKGYRLTPQRLAIIRILSQDTSHPGAMDVLQKVRKKAPQISMSTVYYTLDMLKKEGLIRELEFYDKDNRYDVNVKDHINLICRKCGKIEDFAEAPPFSFKMIEEQTGFRPEGTRFEYYGYCKGCRDKRKR
jgi:Fur family transcriptional regulator, peroxide stress response regulator